ncbi:SET and MYND domain-containing protein 4-like [Sitodiplosis mosellana]|uniref:SET and MYND domain-containing protein 4-like n=1 Tax=Sitodiplosis mosellana TaxID=263140 RepID=UPI002444D196|nr:SET and MYND domain-containing protein 4-like [Sitodiplosis mosellana]
MEWYNRSLCHAEEASEPMGLAYANRSACFFHLKMYSKCLIDIELAKQNSYPRDKMAKLDERKAKCLSVMKTEENQGAAFEPKLDFKPSEKFPCSANVLRIENNDKYGRHVVANEDIDVGKIVMVDQNYFADTIKRYTRCNICFATNENFKPCQRCSFTLLCPKCEENSFHTIECDINPTYFGTLGIVGIRMVAVRSILLAMNAFADIDELIAAVEEMIQNDVVEAPESLLGDSQSNYRAFFKLHPNPEHHTDDNLPNKINFIYRLLMGQRDVTAFFRSDAHTRFLKHLIAHHLIVIKYSSQHFRYPTGVGALGGQSEIDYEYRMSILASYFNSSCAPNAYIFSQSGYNVCVVVRTIRKNEQVCVAYDTSILLKAKSKRQQILQNKFKFLCKCQRCQSSHLESSSLKSNDAIISDRYFHNLRADIKCATDNFDSQSFEPLRAQCFNMLKKYDRVPLCLEINCIMDDLNTLAVNEKTGLLKVSLMSHLAN